MVVVVEMPTDLNQQNNVKGTVEVSKIRVGILIFGIYLIVNGKCVQ